MEDILQFLFIAGLLAIGIARQYKKEAKKNADSKPTLPVPEIEFEKEILPEDWGKTYGGYIPEGPASQPMMQTSKPTKKQKTTPPKPFLKGESAYQPLVMPPSDSQPMNSTSSESEEKSDYQIHSAEEARRAIIWSEILQRKY